MLFNWSFQIQVAEISLINFQYRMITRSLLLFWKKYPKLQFERSFLSWELKLSLSFKSVQIENLLFDQLWIKCSLILLSSSIIIHKLPYERFFAWACWEGSKSKNFLDTQKISILYLWVNSWFKDQSTWSSRKNDCR